MQCISKPYLVAIESLNSSLLNLVFLSCEGYKDSQADTPVIEAYSIEYHFLRKTLQRRINLWKSGKSKVFLFEARFLQRSLRDRSESRGSTNWQKQFCKLVREGKTTATLRLLNNDYPGTSAVLSLNQEIGGRTVESILQETVSQRK
ncbi:hypothetical protein GJ496_006856 [Pomphorhynchus laevis]|nr:hypothetical protein GJ496_006856 [Pomphorhynchus laevis]